jgi:hypothetical protein
MYRKRWEDYIMAEDSMAKAYFEDKEQEETKIMLERVLWEIIRHSCQIHEEKKNNTLKMLVQPSYNNFLFLISE